MIQLFRPLVTEEAIQAANDVLRSGWIGLGPKTAEFEKNFAEYTGAKYAVALNSATSALHLALIVSGIKEDDEVLTTSLTFISTNHVILYENAKPVFVDVDNKTLNIDLNKAEKLITEKTKAIIAVHYAGNPVDIDKLYSFASKHNLKVIEDAAHACGAEFNGRKIGSYGLTCFSFHAVKNLPISDGGMITTNDEEIYKELIKLRWMGIDRSTFARSAGNYQWEYEVTDVGYKYHLNDVFSAIGIEHLKKLDEWNSRRRQIAAAYRNALASISTDNAVIVEDTPGALSSQHICAIRVPNRDHVVDRLKELGVSVGVHYKPNHHYVMYRNARRGDLSITDRAYKELISLPLHLLLSDEDVQTVCDALKTVLQ